ncbi:nucleotidyltransferase domain-containing protein [Microbacterium sp.]|uniref:nucleotidyltransferase domain-containing protein n=1 Tax=Microbacterium sp. TaxID=51671 RepID=UPI003C717A0E
MTLLDIPTRTSTVEHALNTARSRIEVTPEELAEARRRRDAIADALEREFGGHTYVNGSIAHGDALNPLTDVDLGIVVPDPDGLYGPGLRGPGALQESATDAIRREPKDEYPKLRVEHINRHRSILVRFGDPVTPGKADFTADVITAIDNRTGAGLYIPNYHTWDRSHPERHTELVKEANAVTRSTFARGTRLMKHWNRKHDRPICSWNIKALALGCIIAPVTMTDYISTWLNHAIEQLSIGETPDPAGVAGPIKINEKFTMTQVIAEFKEAKAIFDRALMLEDDGYPILALNELAKFFADEEMMPRPDQSAVRAAEAARFKAKTFSAPARVAATASTTALADRINTRSWSC